MKKPISLQSLLKSLVRPGHPGSPSSLRSVEVRERGLGDLPAMAPQDTRQCVDRVLPWVPVGLWASFLCCYSTHEMSENFIIPTDFCLRDGETEAWRILGVGLPRTRASVVGAADPMSSFYICEAFTLRMLCMLERGRSSEVP